MKEQLDLWTMPSLNPVPRVKEAMRQALKGSKWSREQVVEKINDLARAEGLSTNGRAQKATPEMLDKWVSQSGDHIIPWKLLPIFCRVVEDVGPLAALAAPVGAVVIDKQDALLLEWARAEIKGRQLKKRQRQLSERLEL
jgi:hypothetical protein